MVFEGRELYKRILLGASLQPVRAYTDVPVSSASVPEQSKDLSISHTHCHADRVGDRIVEVIGVRWMQSLDVCTSIQ
jgi:hypothetical protein